MAIGVGVVGILRWCSWEIISDLAIPSLKMGQPSMDFWCLMVFRGFHPAGWMVGLKQFAKRFFFAGSTCFHHSSLKTRHRKPSVRSNIPCRFLFLIVYHHIPCKFGVTSPSLQRPTDVQLQVLIFKVLWLGYPLINYYSHGESPFLDGKTQYFDWAMASTKQAVKSPEGKCQDSTWGVPLGDNPGKDSVTSCSAEVPPGCPRKSLSGPSKEEVKKIPC